jgi:hypothetical protein
MEMTVGAASAEKYTIRFRESYIYFGEKYLFAGTA